MDNPISGADFPMGCQVLDYSLVLCVGVQTRDDYRLLLLSSWSDDACPETLLQLKALTLVEEPLDVDRRMESHIHHTFSLWAARYTSEVRTVNPKPCQQMVTFRLG